ncbi:MAG: type II secretion system protein, partial [Planctomycetota bacterium]
MRRNANLRPGRRGFSLIELLVVIGIVALLIAILLPALSSAKDAAAKVHCSSQVRQIGIALEVYANDFRDLYPVAGSKIDWGQIDPTTNLPSWMEQLFTYLPSQDVLSGCHRYPRDTPYHYFLGARAHFAENGTFGSVRRLRLRFTSAYVLLGDNTWDFGETPTPDADKDDYTQNTLLSLQFPPGTVQNGAQSWEPQH